MMHMSPLPPLPGALPEQMLAYYAELARQDAEDWQWFCCLMASSLIVLSVMGYIIIGAVTQ